MVSERPSRINSDKGAAVRLIPGRAADPLTGGAMHSDPRNLQMAAVAGKKRLFGNVIIVAVHPAENGHS